jgi:glycosyltransferase involved in cell wall biosynthesis
MSSNPNLSKTLNRAQEPMSRALFASSSLGCDFIVNTGPQKDTYNLLAQAMNPSARVITIHPSSGRNQSLGIKPDSTVLVRADLSEHGRAAIEETLTLRESGCEVRFLLNVSDYTDNLSNPDSKFFGFKVFEENFRTFAINEEVMDFQEITSLNHETISFWSRQNSNFYCLPKTTSSYIAAFLHSNGFGGAEKSHVEVCQDLISSGNMVRTFLPLVGEGVESRLRLVGSSVEDYPSTLSWWVNDINETFQTSILKHFLSSSAMSWLREKNWDGYDAILTQTSVSPLGALVALDSNKPHYWWIREFGDLDHNFKFPLEVIEMGSLFKNLSAQVITNSRAVKRHFYGEDEEEVLVIEPTPRNFGPLRTMKPSVPHISLVGALNPGKGGDVLLAALSKLRKRGLIFTASLRGPGHQNRVLELKNSIDSLGLKGIVTLDQTLNTLDELYSETSIIVVASRNEAFGRVPFEATFFNCAIVYSRSGGLLEYMVDGVTGLSFTPNDASELAEKLEILLRDSKIADKLISSAKKELLSDERQRSSLEKLSTVFRSRNTSHEKSLLQKVIKSELIERDSLITERDSLITSNSWKLTKPLRAVSDIVRTLKGL